MYFVFVFVLCLYVCLLCLVLQVPVQYCCLVSWSHTILLLGPPFYVRYPKPPLSVEGTRSWYKTATRPVSLIALLTLLLGNWFWYETVTRPNNSTRGGTQQLSSLQVSLAQKLCSSHMQIWLGAKGPICEGVVGFPC